MQLVRYIIIRNGKDTRLVAQRPQLDANEVAVRVVINAPNPPRIIGEIEITLPSPPPVQAEATVEPYPEPEGEGAA